MLRCAKAILGKRSVHLDIHTPAFYFNFEHVPDDDSVGSDRALQPEGAAGTILKFIAFLHVDPLEHRRLGMLI